MSTSRWNNVNKQINKDEIGICYFVLHCLLQSRYYIINVCDVVDDPAIKAKNKL